MQSGSSLRTTLRGSVPRGARLLRHRTLSVQNDIDEKRVVSAPISGETIIDAGNLRVVGKKLSKPFYPCEDFVLLNQFRCDNRHILFLFLW